MRDFLSDGVAFVARHHASSPTDIILDDLARAGGPLANVHAGLEIGERSRLYVAYDYARARSG
jgi:hypothetical protein